jgi:hypothetical protein
MLQRGPAMAVATLACLAGSTHAQIGGLVARELAGNDLAQFPFFEYVKAINEGAAVRLGLDPGTNPAWSGTRSTSTSTAHKTIAGWTSSPALVAVSGGAETVTPVAGTIQANTLVVDAGTLSGNAGIELGVGYDLVLDVNQDGALDAGDYIDGYGDEAGFYVCANTVAPGPLEPVELTYDLSPASFDAQNTFTIPRASPRWASCRSSSRATATATTIPVVRHLGTHLASYGYVFMSHENNTGPGVEFAATTTLSNTGRLHQQPGDHRRGRDERPRRHRPHHLHRPQPRRRGRGDRLRPHLRRHVRAAELQRSATSSSCRASRRSTS